jgi:hypothetical protein
VETIGSDNEVEPACWAAFENDIDTCAVLFNAGNAITEYGFVPAVNFIIDQLG